MIVVLLLVGRSPQTPNSYAYRVWGVLIALSLGMVAFGIITGQPIAGHRWNNFILFVILAALAVGTLWICPRLDHARPGFYWRIPESTEIRTHGGRQN